MSTSLKLLAPAFEPYARRFLGLLEQNRVPVNITSTRRSHAQQVKLYRDYITGRSVLPAAAPGTSMHEIGLAIDLVLGNPPPGSLYPDLQRLAGRAWQRAGGVWGGEADPVHFQAPGHR